MVYDMVSADVLDRMEPVGVTVIAEEVLDPGQTASARDALLGSTNADAQPQSGDYLEDVLQGYQTDTNPAQPAPLLPLLHVAFPTMTSHSVQNPPEVLGYSEGLPHAYTANAAALAQPAPALSHHHHDPPESTLSLQNIHVQPEAVEYWTGLPQAYPCNASNSQPAHAYDLSAFPAWPQQNIIAQGHTQDCSDGPPQVYNSNLTHPAALYPPQPHPALPSWPEQNIQAQQSEGYWDGAFRPPVPYALTIPSMYHAAQCQDSGILQSNHQPSAVYAYEGQVRRKKKSL